ncbi:MAG: GDYXXLXY domain-containing protein [Phormidesmis sp.]
MKSNPNPSANSSDSQSAPSPMAKPSLPPRSPSAPVQPVKQPTIPKMPHERTPTWRFLVALLIQTALIVAVPLKSAVTYATGQTVTLQTAPVDPYDMLRGYSQTLGFEISDVEQLKQLPGAETVFLEQNSTAQNSGLPAQLLPAQIYVTLESPSAAQKTSEPPAAWQPVAISLTYPENLADNQVALQGQSDGWQMVYGLETYYMPEAQRNDINSQITQVQQETQQAEAQAFVMDVKVDDKGNSVPLSLWVRNQEFRF